MRLPFMYLLEDQDNDHDECSRWIVKHQAHMLSHARGPERGNAQEGYT
jgi:hypothetical protein